MQITKSDTGGEGPSQQAARPRITGIEFNRPVQQIDASIFVLGDPRPDIGHCSHDAAPGIEAFRRLALEPKTLCGVKLRLDRRDNVRRDLILYGEDVSNGTVV